MKKATSRGKKKQNKTEQTELEQLGARIRALRKARGYTSQETFAYDHDFNRVQYNKYERGGDVRFSTLVRILKAMDISLKDFFKEGFD